MLFFFINIEAESIARGVFHGVLNGLTALVEDFRDENPTFEDGNGREPHAVPQNLTGQKTPQKRQAKTGFWAIGRKSLIINVTFFSKN